MTARQRAECRGQSLVEYGLLLIVIILALVAVLNGRFRTAINSTVENSATGIENASARIAELGQ